MVPLLFLFLGLAGCGEDGGNDTGEPSLDGGSSDGGSSDGGSSDGGSTDGGSSDGGSTDGGADGGSSDGGSSDGGAEGALRCPDGMVLVPDGDDSYCIDAYEASLDGGALVSVPGVVPLTGVSFDDARSLCQARKVVDGGTEVGHMRMASLQQWLDAADGVVGDGGSPYPYGDVWDDDACATPSADGTVVLSEMQTTGSFPDCISAFGTYDQVGNAWEWADPGISVRISDWVAAREAEGIFLEFGDDGSIRWLSGDFSQVQLNVAGVDLNSMAQDEEGVLVVAEEHLQASTDGSFAFKGFINPIDPGEVDGSDFLPVHVELSAARAAGYAVWVDWDEDATPLTAKVGCAWYTGSQSGCVLGSVYYSHTHDFTGSIGTRCVADPLPGE